MSSEKLWSGIRVHNPIDDKYYRTKYKGETVEDSKVTVHLDLVLEEGQ